MNFRSLLAIGLLATDAAAEPAVLSGYPSGKCHDILLLHELEEQEEIGSGDGRVALFLDSFLSGVNAFAVIQAETPHLAFDFSEGPYDSARLRVAKLLDLCMENPERPIWEQAYLLYVETLRSRLQ